MEDQLKLFENKNNRSNNSPILVANENQTQFYTNALSSNL